MAFEMEDLGHRNRPYIKNLRNDPRTRQLMNSWVVQAQMEVEAQRGRPRDEGEAREVTHLVAERAVALAMAFVLDNDGEYRMVCEERDRVLKASLDLTLAQPSMRVPTGLKSIANALENNL